MAEALNTKICEGCIHRYGQRKYFLIFNFVEMLIERRARAQERRMQEVTKVAHYWLEINAMTRPMMAREDQSP